jgi:hypothetical protein
MSATRTSWLFVSQAGKLDEKQKQHVGQMSTGHPDLQRAYQLSQDCVMMLAERRGADLDTWLTQAEQSGLASIQKNGERDSPGLCSRQSRVCFRIEQWKSAKHRSIGGPLQKRIVFGRASFVLTRASRSLSR